MDNTAVDDIARALRHHQAGALADAEQAYRSVLARDPGNVDALHLLGVIRLQGGDAIEAETLLRRSLERLPSAKSFSNLGAALRRQNRRSDAIDAFRKALTMKPDYAEAHANLAGALRSDGQTRAADQLGRRPLRLGANPTAARLDRPAAYGSPADLGDTEYKRGRFAQAAAAYRRALIEQPDRAGLWSNIAAARRQGGLSDDAMSGFRTALILDPLNADAHTNFGNELKALGQADAATAAHRRAAILRPDLPAAYNNMGSVLGHEATPAPGLYRRALMIRRDYADAYYNFGSSLKAVGDEDRAEPALRRALVLRPDYVSAYNNLTLLRRDLGDPEHAIRLQTRSLRVQPDNPESHLNLALLHMLQGAFAEGFDHYEWRFRGEALKPLWRPFSQPQWRGEPGNGRTLLLWSEQGLGDTLQFARYVPMAQARGWRVILEAPRSLHRMLSALGTEVTLREREAPLPNFDAHCPLLSLPLAFGTTVRTVPAPVPYLAAQPERRAAWRSRLPGDGLRVGIVWQGNPVGKIDRGRSYPLAAAAPLARIPGVTLISLQRIHGLEQLDSLPAGMKVEVLGADVDAGDDAFVDTAAIAEELDLIVSSDTAVAHLAGALGRPVWLALQTHADWRWLQGRDDSPWYPATRLFRQPHSGDWVSVFDRMAEELKAVVDGDTARLRPPPPAVPNAPVSTAPPPTFSAIRVEVSPGELLDKLTILAIKLERIEDPDKRRNVAVEHALLSQTAADALPPSAELADLTGQLKAINERLWVIEDDIRDCERAGNFGETFIELARSVYRINDERATVKRSINTLLNSGLVEEKSYKSYT